MGNSHALCPMSCQICDRRGVAAAAICVCSNTFCVACVERWFETIFEKGFNGSCPAMRCPGCNLIVPMQIWARFMKRTLGEEHLRRAANLLALQCGTCHRPHSLLVESPDSDDSYHQAVSSAERMFQSQSSFRQILYRDLPRYERGEPTHTAEKFLELILSNITDFRVMESDRKESVFKDFLKLIKGDNDPERRANLHLRFIREYPVVMTPCCGTEHCGRCHTYGFHHNQSCEEYQAARAYDNIVTCPNCNIFLVKGDGCDSVNCVCGTNFNWSTRLHALQRALTDAFIATFDGQLDAAAWEAARILAQTHKYTDEQVRAATQFAHYEATSYSKALPQLWPIIQPNLSSAAWAAALRAQQREQGRQGPSMILPESQQPLLRAWADANRDALVTYSSSQHRIRASVFRDLYPDDPDVAALLIAREQRRGAAWSPEIRAFAESYLALLPQPWQLQAQQRLETRMADEWISRYPSVMAAAKAAWQQDQWQSVGIAEPHPLALQQRYFMCDPRYRQLLSNGALNMSATELWATGWSRFVNRASADEALRFAKSMLVQSDTANSSDTSEIFEILRQKRRALNQNSRQSLLEAIRATALARTMRTAPEPSRRAPPEFVAVVDNWWKTQQHTEEESVSVDECLKVGVSSAC